MKKTLALLSFVAIIAAVATAAPSAPRPVIIFEPASPIALSNNTSVNVHMSEIAYTGSFELAGCSTARPAYCMRVRDGFTCYENSMPGDVNSISATIYFGSATMRISNYATGTNLPPIRCHFRIKDERGNSAIYTVMSP